MDGQVAGGWRRRHLIVRAAITPAKSRLIEAASALAHAVTMSDIASITLRYAIAALGASGGSVFLSARSETDLELVAEHELGACPDRCAHRWRFSRWGDQRLV